MQSMSQNSAEEPFEEPEQSDEVELVFDGVNILAVGASKGAVERVLEARGLLKYAKSLNLAKLSPMIQTGGAIAEQATKVAGEFGMWLKVTPESARAIQDAGLIDTGVKGVKYAVVGAPGKIQSWVSVETGAGAMMTNPALLAGAAGLLSQAARQQEAAQLKALLESIDGKLDKVLRAQRDVLLGNLEGIEDELREAFAIRENEGRVDEITWSKVQGESAAIKKTLRTALRNLHGLAEDLEKQQQLGDISSSVAKVHGEAQSWLSVVATCFRLQDQMAVLELDRVLELEPGNVNKRRLSLEGFRENYQEQVLATASELMKRMDAAAARADRQGIIHYSKAPAAVEAIDETKQTIAELVKSLGVELALEVFQGIDWKEALKSKEHLKAAGKEAGVAAVKVVGAAAVVVVTALAAKNNDGKTLGGGNS